MNLHFLMLYTLNLLTMNGNIVNKLYCSLNFWSMLINHFVCNDMFLHIDFWFHIINTLSPLLVSYMVSWFRSVLGFVPFVSYRTKHTFENVPHARAVVINCMILSSWYRSPYCVFVRWCGIVSVRQLIRCYNAKQFKVRLCKSSNVWLVWYEKAIHTETYLLLLCMNFHNWKRHFAHGAWVAVNKLNALDVLYRSCIDFFLLY